MRLVGCFDNVNGEAERALTLAFLERHNCSEVAATPGEEGLQYDFVAYVADHADIVRLVEVCMFALGATASEIAIANVVLEDAWRERLAGQRLRESRDRKL